MTAGREERSADELDQEFRAALETINERRIAEDREAYEHEIAALEQLLRAVVEADRAAYKERHQVGAYYFYPRGPNPPEFPQEWWDGKVAELRKPPPGAGFRERLTEVPSGAHVEQPTATERPKRRKQGKTYDTEIVATVIRRVANGVPSRAMRDELYRDNVGTTTLIDHILGLTRDKRRSGAPYKRLSATRRERWERAANELIDDGTVTLDELTKRLK